MSDTPVDQMTFEQAMKELETVVGKLERGDVALEFMDEPEVNFS